MSPSPATTLRGRRGKGVGGVLLAAMTPWRLHLRASPRARRGVWVLVVLGAVLLPAVLADWLSVNAGGTSELVVTPSDEIEGVFWPLTLAPAPLIAAPPAGGRLPDSPPGRPIEVPCDVRVEVQAGHYTPGDNVPIRIRINNTGRVPDHDAKLAYYLQDANGTVWDLETEANLEVEPGVTTYDRTLVLPHGAAPGQWHARTVCTVSRLDPSSALDTFYVERPWQVNWFMAIVLDVALVAVMVFALGVRRGRRGAASEDEEEDGEEEGEVTPPP